MLTHMIRVFSAASGEASAAPEPKKTSAWKLGAPRASPAATRFHAAAA